MASLVATAAAPLVGTAAPSLVAVPEGDGTFLDIRELYLAHVRNTTEKWVIAKLMASAAQEICKRLPPSELVKLFDAGVGNGAVLLDVMHAIHATNPDRPILAVGKEFSGEDVGKFALHGLAHFFELHPKAIVVMTNLPYTDAPSLLLNPDSGKTLDWHNIELEGNSTFGFKGQIHDLESFVAHQWRTKPSLKTGNQIPVQPTVLVLYRQDQREALKDFIPRQGQTAGLDYHLSMASQPYRAQNALDEFKIKKVLAPLAEALTPGIGQLISVHSVGGKDDISETIAKKLWPHFNAYPHSGEDLRAAAERYFTAAGKGATFTCTTDAKLLSYGLGAFTTGDMGGLGAEFEKQVGDSTGYIGQIPDALVLAAHKVGAIRPAVQHGLKIHGGVVLYNNAVVRISRGPV